jgi:hypothetical protein
MKFGFVADSQDMQKAINQAFKQFVRHISLTLESFATQIPTYAQPKKIILITRDSTITKCDTLLAEQLDAAVEFFNTRTLLSDNLVLKAPTTHIPLINIIPLGAAYQHSPASSFDLLNMTDPRHAKHLLKQQLLTTCMLTILFFGLLISYGYTQRSAVHTHINNAKHSALQLLIDEFNVIERNLAAAIESAQQRLTEDESIWEGFAGRFKHSFLKYLQELCILIDRQGLGLELNNLSMDKKNMILVGNVRDYDALTTLEEVLNSSKLFKLISIPQELKFEIKLRITNEDAE